jgi:hypothetical protein
VRLTERFKDDGAPREDPQSFPGFAGPISVQNYHGYRVIDPPATATRLDTTITVARAPSRLVRFVDPEGRAISGVKVFGLAASSWRYRAVILDDAEAEVLALEPGKTRRVDAISGDGKYVAAAWVGVDDEQPKSIVLKPAGSFSGKLVEAVTGRPLPSFDVRLSYRPNELDKDEWIPWMGKAARTDADGRFLVGGVIPDVGVSILLADGRPFFGGQEYKLDSLSDLVVDAGEVRDLGEISIDKR